MGYNYVAVAHDHCVNSAFSGCRALNTKCGGGGRERLLLYVRLVGFPEASGQPLQEEHFGLTQWCSSVLCPFIRMFLWQIVTCFLSLNRCQWPLFLSHSNCRHQIHFRIAPITEMTCGNLMNTWHSRKAVCILVAAIAGAC